MPGIPSSPERKSPADKDQITFYKTGSYACQSCLISLTIIATVIATVFLLVSILMVLST